MFDLTPWTSQGRPVWLDIGCGHNPQNDYIGVDISPDVGAPIRCNMEFERLPLPDNSVDKILWRFSLEHVYNIVHALEECWRVLKPTGLLEIMGMPYPSNLESQGNPFHVTHADEHLFDYFGGDRCHESDYGLKFAYQVVSMEYTWFPDFHAVPHEQREYARRHLCNSVASINWLVRPANKVTPDGELVVMDLASDEEAVPTAALEGGGRPGAQRPLHPSMRAATGVPRPIEEYREEALRPAEATGDAGQGNPGENVEMSNEDRIVKLIADCLEAGRLFLESSDPASAARAFAAITCLQPEAAEGYVGLDGALRAATEASHVPRTVAGLAAGGSLPAEVAEAILAVICDHWPEDEDAVAALKQIRDNRRPAVAVAP